MTATERAKRSDALYYETVSVTRRVLCDMVANREADLGELKAENAKLRELVKSSITPEQAIAATLGPGTCHVASSIIDTYEYNRWEYELSCGHTIIWEDSEPPRYCPECGRRIEQ